jgi:hypothetical protein
VTDHERLAQIQANVDPRAARYYVRRTLAAAIADTITRIEEWDYESDAHGYCHVRPDWLLLVDALARRDAAIQALQEPDQDETDALLVKLNRVAAVADTPGIRAVVQVEQLKRLVKSAAEFIDSAGYSDVSRSFIGNLAAAIGEDSDEL